MLVIFNDLFNNEAKLHYDTLLSHLFFIAYVCCIFISALMSFIG